MRIAFFADNFYPELSGISDSIIITGTELARKGHHIEYFVPSYSKENYDTAGVAKHELNLGPNIKIHRIASVPYKTPTLQGRAAMPHLLRGIFSRNKFDIIHSHSFFGPGIDALCLSKVKGIPLVGTNHTLISAFTRYSPIQNKRFNNFIERYVVWYYDKCDLVTTPSEFMLNDMKAKGLRTSAMVVSNPIEDAFFTPRLTKNALKKELGLSSFTVLYVGRISYEKNIEVLLEAFISFAKNAPDANLVIVGQGSTRKTLEDRVRKDNLSSQIKIIGPFLGNNKNKLYDIFHASDVFVMPSTSETQSMCLIQAMAGGMPVIAARAGALPGLLSPERGFLFEPDYPKELCSHLNYLYSQSKLREKLGNNGRLFVRKFSKQEISSKWEKLYNNVIERYHAKTRP